MLRRCWNEFGRIWILRILFFALALQPSTTGLRLVRHSAGINQQARTDWEVVSHGLIKLQLDGCSRHENIVLVLVLVPTLLLKS